MKKTFQIIIALIVLVIIGGVVYTMRMQTAIAPNDADVTYTNDTFGFTFNYPSSWNLKESADKRTVNIDVGIDSGSDGPQGPIDVLSIEISAIDVDKFGTVQTKVGEIVYDAIQNTIVDTSEQPYRCLANQYTLGILSPTKVSLPSIGYGGSTMSDPAWGQSAILTNKDYLISIYTAKEPTGDEIKDALINKLESGIYSSFKFVNGVEARVQKCGPAISSVSPASGPIGTKVELKGQNFAGFEGDKYAWIENTTTHVKGIIYGNTASSTDAIIPFTLESKYCTADTSYSGLPCPSYLTITPGNYEIFVSPWGKMSNKVQFTVTK